MSNYIAEAHADWHVFNGKFAICPWDCGANEPDVWECAGCGAEFASYPSNPDEVYRDCSDPAACDVIIAKEAAKFKALQEAEAAAKAAQNAANDPWAVIPF